MPAQTQSGRKRFLNFSARMSRTLGAADSETLGVAVRSVLEDVATWCGADAAFVSLVDEDVLVTDEWNWCRPGTALIPPAIGSPLGEIFGSALEFLRLGHTLAIEDLAAIDLGPAERRLATVNNLRAMAVAPVRVEGIFLGVVGVHSFGRPRRWEPEVVGNIELVAALLVQTVVRTRERGAIEQANARARRIARFVPSPLVMLDGAGRVSWTSPSYSAVTGRAQQDVLGSPVSDMFVAGDPGPLGDFRGPGTAMARLLRADGTWRWTELSWQPFDDDVVAGPGDPGDQVVIELRDVHERQLQTDELRRDADHDQLTGTLSRQGLARRISELSADKHMVLTAFCDLNGFKRWNDTRGHDAGDAMLREVGRALMSTVRAADLVARVGGDEFVVIVVDPSGHDRQGLEERIQEAVRAVPTNQGAHAVTVAVGVSGPGPASDAGSQRLAADHAMYARKRDAGGR